MPRAVPEGLVPLAGESVQMQQHKGPALAGLLLDGASAGPEVQRSQPLGERLRRISILRRLDWS